MFFKEGRVLIDTNVCMFRGFIKPNEVVCLTTVSELESHKSGFQDKNKKARACLRQILNNPDKCVPDVKVEGSPDDTIINTAKKGKFKLLSNDVAMIVKARGLGVKVEFFVPEEVKKKDEEVSYGNLEYNLGGCFEGDCWGITPRNDEQSKLLKALTDKNIPLVSAVGRSGSGKTLLTLAAGLKGCEDKVYEGIIIIRKITTVGNNEIGYLKGDKTEKLMGSAGSILDNLKVLCGNSGGVRDLLDTGVIEFESLGHIRGRSLNNMFVICDETQNTTFHEIKTLLTRIGEGSKVVLTGDLNQIDCPQLSEFNNGLALVSHAFRGSSLASGAVLKKCVRSALATEAIERLN